MATNTRGEIVAHSLALIRAGGTLSFESVARATGLSKPGLMYHFATKEALMVGLVDAVTDDWLDEMASRLTSPLDQSTVRERIVVYVDACVMRDADPADIVMLTDPRLREELTARWTERMSVWFVGLDELPVEQQGYLTAVRLMADGVWFAGATGIGVPPPDVRPVILAAAHELLSKVDI